MKNRKGNCECTNPKCGHKWTDHPGANAEVVFLIGQHWDERENWEARCPKCMGRYWTYTEMVNV